MKNILIVLAVVVLVLILSPRLRRIVFHLRVRRFVIIVVLVTVLAGASVGGYFAWKLWWPAYMAKPTMQWTDTTVEQDLHPVTPGI